MIELYELRRTKVVIFGKKGLMDDNLFFVFRCQFGKSSIFAAALDIYYGEMPITCEHIQNNKTVREMLGKRGIKPEELPPAEDIKKMERRVAGDEKKIEKSTKKLPKKNE